MAGSPSLPSRILQLAKDHDISISAEDAERLATFCRLLERWNRTINLTALPLAGFPVSSLQRLIVEPLVVARRLDRQSGVWFDLGSGGGSPAIPIKIILPSLRLTMVESKSRKSAFLREAIRELGLADTEVADVVTERIEELANRPAIVGTADFVTVRAVRPDLPLLTALASLLAAGGRAALFGSASTADLTSAGLALIDTTPLPGDGNLVSWLARSSEKR